MSLEGIKTNMIFFAISLLLCCLHASPVLKNQPNDEVKADEALNPIISEALKPYPVNQMETVKSTEKIKDNSLNNNNNNNNAEAETAIPSGKQSQTESKSSLVSHQGQAQNEAESLPLLKSLSPSLSKVEAGSVNSHPIEITKEFAQKVLQAFFAELRNRPNLVDEILRRETFRLLLSIAQDEDNFNPIPPDVDLTQNFIPGLALQNENPNSDGAVDASSIIETVIGEGDEVSKKSVLEKFKPGGLKTLSSIPIGDKTSSEASKLQAALAKELDNIGHHEMTVNNADASNVDNDEKVVKGEKEEAGEKEEKGDEAEEKIPSQQLLIDPYYYYVYYDENEVPNSDSAGNKVDIQKNPNTAGSEVKNKAIKAVEKKSSGINDNSKNIPESGRVRDAVVDKIASAVKSVIVKDMENQLAKSRLALNKNLATDKDSQQFPDINLDHHAMKGSQGNNQRSEEEDELTNLVQ